MASRSKSAYEYEEEAVPKWRYPPSERIIAIDRARDNYYRLCEAGFPDFALYQWKCDLQPRINHDG